MAADTKDYALEISDLLFRMTTEGVRLFSNQIRSQDSLSSLTKYLLRESRDATAHDTDVLLQHLDIIPTHGDIMVCLVMSTSCAARLEALRTLCEKKVGRPLTTGDTLSLLLFDYMVERKAARVLEKFGVAFPDGSDSGDAPNFFL